MAEKREELLVSVKRLLRSLLLSEKDGLTPEKLQYDYRAFTGSALPYAKLGQSSTLGLLQSMPDVARMEMHPTRGLVVHAISVDVTKGMSRLISSHKRRKRGRSRQAERARCAYAPLPSWLRAMLGTVLRAYPSGLAVADLPDAFMRRTGIFLNWKSLGYNSLEVMLAYATDVVAMETLPTGRVMLRSAINASRGTPKGRRQPTQSTQPTPLPQQEEDSGQVRATMGSRSLVRFMEPRLKVQIYKVVSESPDGILASQLPSKFKAAYGFELPMVRLGFTSACGLVSTLGVQFDLTPMPNGDVVVRMAEHSCCQPKKDSAAAEASQEVPHVAKGVHRSSSCYQNPSRLPGCKEERADTADGRAPSAQPLQASNGCFATHAAPSTAAMSPAPLSTAANSSTPLSTASTSSTSLSTAAPSTPLSTAVMTPAPLSTAAPSSTPLSTAAHSSTPLSTAAPSTPLPAAAPSSTPLPTAAMSPAPLSTAAPSTPLSTAAPSSTPLSTAARNSAPLPTAARNSAPLPTTAQSSAPLPTAARNSAPVSTAAPSSTPLPTAARSSPLSTAARNAATLSTAAQYSAPLPTAARNAAPLSTAAQYSAPLPTAAQYSAPLPTAAQYSVPLSTAAQSCSPAAPCPAWPVVGVGPGLRFRRHAVVAREYSMRPLYVSYMDSPGQFFVQNYGMDTSEALEDLVLDMKRLYASPDAGALYALPAAMALEGQVCAALSDDEWDRSVLLGPPGADGMVPVYYVDYGQMGTVQLHHLRLLPCAFFSLPAQAVPARLACVAPAEGSWCTTSRRLFLQLCHDRVLMAIVCSTRHDVLSLCLCDTMQREDLHFNDLFVSLGLALAVHPENDCYQGLSDDHPYWRYLQASSDCAGPEETVPYWVGSRPPPPTSPPSPTPTPRAPIAASASVLWNHWYNGPIGAPVSLDRPAAPLPSGAIGGHGTVAVPPFGHSEISPPPPTTAIAATNPPRSPVSPSEQNYRLSASAPGLKNSTAVSALCFASSHASAPASSPCGGDGGDGGGSSSLSGQGAPAAPGFTETCARLAAYIASNGRGLCSRRSFGPPPVVRPPGRDDHQAGLWPGTEEPVDSLATVGQPPTTAVAFNDGARVPPTTAPSSLTAATALPPGSSDKPKAAWLPVTAESTGPHAAAPPPPPSGGPAARADAPRSTPFKVKRVELGGTCHVHVVFWKSRSFCVESEISSVLFPGRTVPISQLENCKSPHTAVLALPRSSCPGLFEELASHGVAGVAPDTSAVALYPVIDVCSLLWRLGHRQWLSYCHLLQSAVTAEPYPEETVLAAHPAAPDSSDDSNDSDVEAEMALIEQHTEYLQRKW